MTSNKMLNHMHFRTAAHNQIILDTTILNKKKSNQKVFYPISWPANHRRNLKVQGPQKTF